MCNWISFEWNWIHFLIAFCVWVCTTNIPTNFQVIYYYVYGGWRVEEVVLQVFFVGWKWFWWFCLDCVCKLCVCVCLLWTLSILSVGVFQMFDSAWELVVVSQLWKNSIQYFKQSIKTALNHTKWKERAQHASQRYFMCVFFLNKRVSVVLMSWLFSLLRIDSNSKSVLVR